MIRKNNLLEKLMGKRSGLIVPRMSQILKHRNFKISLALGIVTFIAMAVIRLPARHSQVKVVELSGAILTFTSMGFAVATTAVALILAMPLGRVTALMVVNSRNSPPVQVRESKDGHLKARKVSGAITGAVKQGPKETAYLDLISVFLITAIANVASSVAVIVWAVVAGGDDMLSSHSFENNALTAIAASLVCYSGLQMVTAILTLYNVAELVQGVMRDSLY